MRTEFLSGLSGRGRNAPGDGVNHRGRALIVLASLTVFGTVHPATVSAQSARYEAGKGDDLRAAYATAADVADGRRVAERTCASCHGANGVSTTKGVPSLAGQRPVYLYLELKAYQSGARPVSEMTSITKPLNDQVLVQLAAYYASLEPAQSSPSGAKATPSKPDPVQAGKSAAVACAGCHGDAGVTKTPGTPSLVGLDPKYLVAAMQAYNNGKRKNELMKSVLSAVGEADLSNLALYYALQKPVRAANPTVGDEAAGKSASAACSGCHGDKGVSTNPDVPSLAGQDRQYLVDSMRAYKDGSRSDETMKALAASIDEANAVNMAAFYSSQPPQAPKVRRPLTIAEWTQRCDRCHGVNGNSTDPSMPMLAAQRQDYLEKVMQAYRSGERKSTQMHAMSEGLTEGDVESLAAYYSRQKARAAVYIVLPSK